ncbi:MAG TPA: glycosyltransferase family 39 protein [Caldilinea sp.]|nr:glycosyltransferase family 39 protein [Anaerolineales bacterium]HRA66866.1 glycosyltransferase family 39 protein [Caldilinea sp.]
MLRNRSLLLILGIAVLLRVAVALYLGDATPPTKDETSYSLLAARLAGGYGYSFADAWYPFTPANTPTAHWSFLYTAFVATIYAIVGVHPLAVRLVQAVLTGLLMPWLIWRLARRWQPAHVALIAAALAAVYAYFVLYGAQVQTEGFFLLAVLWSLERSLTLQDKLSTQRRKAATGRSEQEAAKTALSSAYLCTSAPPRQDSLFVIALTLGLSLGVATLLRQSILPWVVVLFMWLLGMNSLALKRVSARTLLVLLIAGLVLFATILPFTLRNYHAYGDFLLLNSNAGYAMYSAQHPLHATSFEAYTAAPLPADLTPLPANEAQWDRALMARGIQFVLADPGRYLLLSASRAADYFEFWPKDSSSLLFNVGRMASFTLLLPFMLYGIGVVSRRSDRRVAWRFLLLFVTFYSLLHIFTWAMPRYRLPVDAVLLLFAAAALADLATHTLPAHN